jgi:chromate transport protein ChrA
MRSSILVFATLSCSAVFLWYDGVRAHETFKQFESRHYPVVTGMVTHSEIKIHRGSKGRKSYEAVIYYRYEVGERAFTGARLRYNPINADTAASARSIVAAHPDGATVQVFYNPENPQDSLLSPGVDGWDCMMVLIMTPFNMLMLGLWIWMGGWLRERLVRPVAGGMKIITDGMITRVRLPQYGAAWWGLGTTGGLGIISMIILGFTTKMPPPLGLALTVLAVIYLAGAGVYLWLWQKIRSGLDDLVIDEAARTLDLPQTFGREQRVTAGIADIESLTVEKIEHRDGRGDISYTYAPTVRLRGTGLEGQKLADWSDEEKAGDFAEWLRKQLGL